LRFAENKKKSFNHNDIRFIADKMISILLARGKRAARDFARELSDAGTDFRYSFARANHRDTREIAPFLRASINHELVI